MQTVLVDIYNYCHRNKQIARQSLTSSTTSSELASTTSPMLRQVSAESNDYGDCHIITEDVFHPEDVRQTVTPFSPVFTDQNKVNLNFPLKFQEDSLSTDAGSPAASAKSVEIPRQPETEEELISAISSSPPSIPKDTQSVHILNKPPANSSERRANRFSVTKILDSLGKNAAGVANKLANVTNMDMKSKKPTPKDEVTKATENPALATEDSATETNSESIENTPKDTETPRSKEEVVVDNITVNCSSRTCDDISLVSSPIEILDVVDDCFEGVEFKHTDDNHQEEPVVNAEEPSVPLVREDAPADSTSGVDDDPSVGESNVVEQEEEEEKEEDDNNSSIEPSWGSSSKFCHYSRFLILTL